MIKSSCTHPTWKRDIFIFSTPQFASPTSSQTHPCSCQTCWVGQKFVLRFSIWSNEKPQRNFLANPIHQTLFICLLTQEEKKKKKSHIPKSEIIINDVIYPICVLSKFHSTTDLSVWFAWSQLEVSCGFTGQQQQKFSIVWQLTKLILQISNTCPFPYAHAPFPPNLWQPSVYSVFMSPGFWDSTCEWNHCICLFWLTCFLYCFLTATHNSVSRSVSEFRARRMEKRWNPLFSSQ